jgi:hypothetical protein
MSTKPPPLTRTAQQRTQESVELARIRQELTECADAFDDDDYSIRTKYVAIILRSILNPEPPD